jgi:hypothetical protein
MLFRDLSLQERAMYHAIVRSKNKKTNQFFHRIDKLAYRAGLDHKSAVYAIRGLIDKEIISRESRPGHSSLYTFLKELPLEDEPALNKVFATTRSVQVSHQQPVAQSHHITTGFKQSNLTTTQLDVKFYSDMVSQYGKEAVDVVVVNLEKMNGEVKNFPGYVRSALKNGYVPTNKTIQEKEKSVERTKKIEEARQKEMIERAEIIKRHEESKMTPEQIKKMLDQVGDFCINTTSFSVIGEKRRSKTCC